MKHLKLFENFNNNESKLNYDEFVEEVKKRVAEHDNEGNPRDEESKQYWLKSIERDIYGHDSYIMSPMSLLHRAYKMGFYNLDDINDQSLGRASEVISHASEGMEGHGFGSSDMTFLVKSFLESEGISAEFINNRLQRLTDEQAEVFDVKKSIETILRWGLGGYNDKYKSKLRKIGDELVDRGLAVKTGIKDARGHNKNEYELTEEGRKLSEMQLAEELTGKKI